MSGSYKGDQPRCVRRALRHHLPELSQMATQRVDELRALPDQELTHAEHHRGSLDLFALHQHKPHRWALGRFTDRLCVGGIILLALHERLHIGRRDQPHVMA